MKRYLTSIVCLILVILISIGAVFLKQRTLKYTDNTPPKIKLIGEKEIILEYNTSYKEQGVIISDDTTSKIELEENLKITDNLDITLPGSYEIIYEVTDKAGNKANIERKVIVKPKKVLDENTVYLTFDDGPGPYTETLLDILNRNKVKATFFITNFDLEYYHVVQRMVEEGHTVALHSYTHDYAKIYSSDEAYIEDLNSIKNKVYDVTSVETKLFRFPGGSSNKVSANYNKGIMTRLTDTLSKQGYKYYDWNVDSKDASGVKLSKSQIVENVITGIKQTKYPVVLQHDIKENSVLAVEEIIITAKQLGYTFDKLTEDLDLEIYHRINN